MTIHWKALEVHFLMIFSIQAFLGKCEFSQKTSVLKELSEFLAVHGCSRAMLYQERDLPCHVTNFAIFGTQCLFTSNCVLI
jgi:hypothetical protein